jgi:hypothetical protein
MARGAAAYKGPLVEEKHVSNRVEVRSSNTTKYRKEDSLYIPYTYGEEQMASIGYTDERISSLHSSIARWPTTSVNFSRAFLAPAVYCHYIPAFRQLLVKQGVVDCLEPSTVARLAPTIPLQNRMKT